MKGKKVLALVLALGACLPIAACGQNDPAKDEKGNKVSQEVFEKVMTEGYCCYNLTWRVPMDDVSTSTAGDTTYTVTTTGDQIVKRVDNVMCTIEQYKTVSEIKTVDSTTGETTTETNETIYDDVMYYELVDGDCFVYTYDDYTQAWEKEVDNTYLALFDGASVAEGIGYAYLIEYFTNKENWTFDEEKGSYIIDDYSVPIGKNFILFDFEYKFKGDHLAYGYMYTKYDDEFPMLGGLEIDREYVYSDHGKTVVTLPTIAE